MKAVLFDILLKIVFAVLAVMFGSMAIIVIIVVIREGMNERGKHGRQH